MVLVSQMNESQCFTEVLFHVSPFAMFWKICLCCFLQFFTIFHGVFRMFHPNQKLVLQYLWGKTIGVFIILKKIKRNTKKRALHGRVETSETDLVATCRSLLQIIEVLFNYINYGSWAKQPERGRIRSRVCEFLCCLLLVMVIDIE